jgi:hypothetical protein
VKHSLPKNQIPNLESGGVSMLQTSMMNELNDFNFDNMNENNFTSTISVEYLDKLDKERSETMSTKAFNDWCNELNVSASYIDKSIHTDNAEHMMNMIDTTEWIATFKRINKNK